MNYVPASSFTHIANQVWAQDLWVFLNKSTSIVRMETAILLGRAPLEGVLKFLDWDYSQYLKGAANLHRRQMVGHMVSQVVSYHLGAYHTRQRTMIRNKRSNFKSAMKFALPN